MLDSRRFLLLFLLSLAACVLPANAASLDEDRVTTVAARFLKDYLGNGYTEYFHQSPLVTPTAKAALRKLEAAAKKKNPELGLGYDPVVQGQEHPEGYRIENVVVEGDRATAEGVAEGFPKITLRLVRNKGGWLVDGAGEVNPAPRRSAKS